MKKFIISFLLITTCFFTSFAQVSVDPTDSFYKNAQNWELKGYIRPLPVVRPYPAMVIKEILETVIDSGNKRDGAIALEEYERIFGQKYSKYVKGSGTLKNSQIQSTVNHPDKENDNSKYISGEFGVAGEFMPHPMVNIGLDLAMFFENGDYELTNPSYVNKPEDSIFDPASIGPVNEYLDWNMNISGGKSNIYAMAGISKVGFGPFLSDGLTLNDSSYHSANFDISFTSEKISYGSSFQILGASTNNVKTVFNDTGNNNLGGGKFLAFHTIKYRFNRYVDFSYYENILFGPTLNPAYLFPVPFMPIQNIGGASDNLQMGILLEVKPVPGFVWATDIFVDDLDVNNVVKLNLDSKNRCAGQTGFIYSPFNSSFTRIELNYQLVIPYVYSHWEYDTGSINTISGNSYNYQNYTNAGRSIGSCLDPNSDKVYFGATFHPQKWLKLDFKTNFIRHANSAEAFGKKDSRRYVLADAGQYATDGSANMHQMFSAPGESRGSHVKQAWDCMGFMTSEHKMGILQAGLNAQIDLPKKRKGQLSFIAGYSFEYVHNDGVRNNMFTGCGLGNNTYKVNGKDWVLTADDEGNVLYNGDVSLKDAFYDDVDKEVEKQKEKWVNNLTDKVNHYITIGLKYTF